MNLKLLNAIKQSGQKQWQIAKAAEMPESRLSKIVNESANPVTIEEQIRLAEVLKKNVADLWGN